MVAPLHVHSPRRLRTHLPEPMALQARRVRAHVPEPLSAPERPEPMRAGRRRPLAVPEIDPTASEP